MLDCEYICKLFFTFLCLAEFLLLKILDSVIIRLLFTSLGVAILSYSSLDLYITGFVGLTDTANTVTPISINNIPTATPRVNLFLLFIYLAGICTSYLIPDSCLGTSYSFSCSFSQSILPEVIYDGNIGKYVLSLFDIL